MNKLNYTLLLMLAASMACGAKEFTFENTTDSTVTIVQLSKKGWQIRGTKPYEIEAYGKGTINANPNLAIQLSVSAPKYGYRYVETKESQTSYTIALKKGQLVVR